MQVFPEGKDVIVKSTGKVHPGDDFSEYFSMLK
jgi:hypothetical protein